MTGINGMIKFAIAFAVTGFIISVVFGFIGQNRISSILSTALLITLLSGLLGAAVHKIIEIRVPELLTLFERNSEESGSESYSDEYVSEADTYQGGEDYTPSVADDAAGSFQEEDSAKVFGDHILVNNKIKIKNEPKLIAKAIQTMLAKDEK